jgi:hypothetical protein
MSMNHHRYFAASAVPAASRRNFTGRNDSRHRNAAHEGKAGNSLPANVVELYPGASPIPNRGHVRLMGSETGMATAEYAIATLAAVGFAGLLVFILRSDEVRGFLLTLIRTALALP